MPASTVAQLLSADIPDPTDFPPPHVAPGLRQLDAALRCTICSELLDGPVTLACGHCFCSACIRVYIGDKAECPQCRKSANEGQLRINPAMEEAVSAWKAARPYVLRVVKDATQGSPQETTRKKRKRSASSQASFDGIECVAGPSSPQRSRSGGAKREEDKGPRKGRTPKDQPTSDGEFLAHDASVDCPVCKYKVPFKDINAHIDVCTSPSEPSGAGAIKGGQKVAWSKILGRPSSPSRKAKGKERDTADMHNAEPLPKVSYAVLKDRKLKDLLIENELWTTGDRNAWIARHQRWVVLHNANLDRAPAQQKALSALRVELRRWEEEMRRPRKAVVKEEDYGAYQVANKTQFKELVEAARPKKAAAEASSGAGSEGE